MKLSYPDDDLNSRLALLTTSLPESARCRHNLRTIGARRQATTELREEWLSRHPQRPYSVYYPSPSGWRLPEHSHKTLQHPTLEENDFHLATLPATLSAPPRTQPTRTPSPTKGKSKVESSRRSVMGKPLNGSCGQQKLLVGGRLAGTGARTPAIKATFAIRAKVEGGNSPIFDALNRPFVPLPHVFESPPGSAMYRQRSDIGDWKDEIEKRVPPRMPLAVNTKLTPPHNLDLSEGEFLSLVRPVFYHAERAAPPRQFIINREWYSEKASLKHAKGHRTNRLVFGWTK